MFKKYYILELLVILTIGITLNYFQSMKPKHMNYNFAFSTTFDYNIKPDDIGIKDVLKPVLNIHQYYRIMDSTNIAKRTYFNFNSQEKIEVINHCYSIGLAFVQIISQEDKYRTNAFKVVPLANLHEKLPKITPVS